MATIEFDPEDTTALQMLLTEVDEDGVVVRQPPDFPLKTGQLVFNGDSATISEMTGGKSRRLCRLTDAKLTEPKRDGDPIVVTGTVERMRQLGFEEESSSITATITKFKACANC